VGWWAAAHPRMVRCGWQALVTAWGGCIRSLPRWRAGEQSCMGAGCVHAHIIASVAACMLPGSALHMCEGPSGPMGACRQGVHFAAAWPFALIPCVNHHAPGLSAVGAPPPAPVGNQEDMLQQVLELKAQALGGAAAAGGALPPLQPAQAQALVARIQEIQVYTSPTPPRHTSEQRCGCGP
jgi:hypothetical protein